MKGRRKGGRDDSFHVACKVRPDFFWGKALCNFAVYRTLPGRIVTKVFTVLSLGRGNMGDFFGHRLLSNFSAVCCVMRDLSAGGPAATWVIHTHHLDSLSSHHTSVF